MGRGSSAIDAGMPSRAPHAPTPLARARLGRPRHRRDRRRRQQRPRRALLRRRRPPEVADDEVAWCAAFLGACLERAGIASTRSLMARSYSAGASPLDEPRYGAIAVLEPRLRPEPRPRRLPASARPRPTVILLGGNQGDAVPSQAFPRTRLLGLRWPADTCRRASPRHPASAPAPCRRPRRRRHLRARPRPRPRDGRRLRRRSLRSRRPHQPRHHARRLRPRPRRRAHRRQLRRAQGRAEGHPAATVRRIYRDRYWRPACLPRSAAAARALPLRCRRQPGRRRRRAHAAAGRRRRHRRRDRPAHARPRSQPSPSRDTLGRLRRDPPPALPRASATSGASAKAGCAASTPRWRWRQRHHRSTPAHSSPPATGGDHAMPTRTRRPTTAPTPPDAKWWGHSMTIWGVDRHHAVDRAAGLGPAVRPQHHRRLVSQLGDQLVTVRAGGRRPHRHRHDHLRPHARHTSLERRQITLNM